MLKAWTSSKWLALFVFGFAILVRTVYLVQFTENPLFDTILEVTDSINWDNGAKSFAQGDFLARSSNNSYSPLYKYFLGLIYLIFGRNFYCIWGIQFFIGALTCVLLFLICSKLTDKKIGFISAIIFSLNGPHIMYEGVLLREFLSTFLGLGTFYFLLRCNEEPDVINCAVASLFSSLFLAIRPNSIFAVAIVFLFLLPKLISSNDRKFNSKRLAIFFAIFLFSLIPLLIQCYLVHKRFVLFDAGGPVTLYAGNLVSYSGAGFTWSEELDGLLKNFGADLFGFLKYFLGLLKDPIPLLQLYLRKLFYYLSNFEIPSNYNFYLFQRFSSLLELPTSNFFIYSSFGIIGLVLGLRRFSELKPLYLFSAGLFLGTILVQIDSRFRIQLIPFFILFSAISVESLFYFLKEKKFFPAMFFLAGAIALMFFLKNPVLQPPLIRSCDFSNLGDAFLLKRQFAKAETLYIEAWNQSILEMNPSFPCKKALIFIFEQLASKALIEDKGELFERNLKKILEIDFDSPKAHFSLGTYFFENNNLKEAEKRFQDYLILSPNNAFPHYILALINKEKNYSKAFFHYKKVEKFDPKLGNKIKHFFFSFPDSNEFKEVKDAKEPLQRNYSYFENHLKLAKLHIKQGQYEFAEIELQESLLVNPESAEARIIFGSLLFEEKRENLKALFLLTSGVRIFPGFDTNGEIAKKIRFLLEKINQTVLHIPKN